MRVVRPLVKEAFAPDKSGRWRLTGGTGFSHAERMTPHRAPERTVSDAYSRGHLQELLSPLLAPAMVDRLWADAWGRLRITPATLIRWHQLFGVEYAALAVASGLADTQLREYADHGPDRAMLEMLADLNCYPYVTPAARPVTHAPWTKHLPQPGPSSVAFAVTQVC